MDDKQLRGCFVEALQELGGSAGNGRLRDTLGWNAGIYSEVYGELLREGVIVAGRGRGGSVRLVDAAGGRAAVGKFIVRLLSE